MSPSAIRPESNGIKGAHTSYGYKTFDARVHRFESIQTDAIAILLRHADQFTPAVIESSAVDLETFAKVQQLTPETLLRVTGTEEYDVQQEKDIFRISKLDILAEARPDIPKNILSHGAPGEVTDDAAATTPEAVQQRLDNRVLDARVSANAAVTKLFSAVFELAVEQLAALDFWRIPTPALIGWEFPGDEHEQFAFNYFDRETAWLSQTGDVHLEMAIAADFERVYDVHTVFRREESATARHMTEFTALEIMWALKKDWTEIMEFAEKLIIFMTRALQKRERYSTLTKAARRIYPRAGEYELGLDKNGRILRLKFSEAKRILRETLGRRTDDFIDITKEEEAILGNYLASDESLVGPPTDIFFLTHFPRGARPYNAYASRDNDVDTHSFDIIMRGQEISTGYQCIHDYKELRHAMATRKHPIDADSVAWKPFVEAHDVGMPPLGGFAIGLNRFLQGFLGAADIRETVLFPRDASRLRP